MADHQLCKQGTVDQDNPFGNGPHVCEGVWTESRSCDDQAFGRLIALETSCERLEDGPANRCLPPLGLNVDHVKAKWILIDRPVDSPVAGFSNSATCAQWPSVAHLEEQINDELLEERG